MSDHRRKKEIILILCFLAIVSIVPVSQVVIELCRGERVQFTDVFRYKPTAKNLRQFERNLEDKSWFQQALRPQMQRLLFHALADTGSKAMMGRDGWLFYRPDVRYLVEPNRLEVDKSGLKWVQPQDGSTCRDSVVRAIVRFRDQLKERGIELLVMPVPGKPCVYPDQLTRRAVGKEQLFRSPTEDLLDDLRKQGVAAVDLFAAFRDSRKNAPAETLFLARDTHWTPAGARAAANAAAQRLRELGWAPAASRRYETTEVPVKRFGDVLEMTQIPGIQSEFEPEIVECEQVRDPALGVLIPSPSDRPGTYRFPAQKSSVLVLGDSYCRIYQTPEPRSLGEMTSQGKEIGGQRSEVRGTNGKEDRATRTVLPGSAGFLSHLALALQAPVDYIVSDGGAATDVRKRLSTNPEILEDKKVVIWEFSERDVALGRQGWEDAPLPPKLGP
jgi:hypothetical protein